MKSLPSILRPPSTALNSTQAAPSSVLVEAKPECPRTATSSAFQALTATTILASSIPPSLTTMPSTFSRVPRSPASSREPPTEVDQAQAQARPRPRPRPLVLPLLNPQPSHAESRNARPHPTSKVLLFVGPDTLAVLCADLPSGRACTNLLTPPAPAFPLFLTIMTAIS